MKKFSLGQGRPCGPFNTSSTCRVKQFSVTAQPALQAQHSLHYKLVIALVHPM